MARYSLRLKSIKIPIEAQDGTEVEYTMMELTGAQRDAFLNDQTKRTSGKDGNLVKNFTGMFSSLLKLCLYDPEGKLVTTKEIDGWPSEMTTDLFLQAVELSGLNKKAEEAEKNS